MKLLGLCGSPTKRSKTLLAVEKAIEYAKRWDPTIVTEIINIRDMDVQFCDGRDPSLYEGNTKKLIDKLVDSDALIIGTPIYRGSYTGLLKNVFDIIPNNALFGKCVGIIATGASDHHYLATEHEIKPLLAYFHVHVVPGCVYANNDHYSDQALVDEGILIRLNDLAQSVIELSKRIPRELRSLTGPEFAKVTRKTLGG
jgi:NAD(P)H-dependent FMN reductase